jgi:anti-anti-sigma factor
MNVKTEQTGRVAIVRVGETRMMYPLLSDFSSAVSGLIAGGNRNILIDLTPVTYVDSATIGCLMDLYRQVSSAGGRLKLSGVQKRVETMLTLTLRGLTMRTIKTTTGADIVLDGDLLAVMEGLYREVTARRELERSFEDLVREIQHLIEQMSDAERRTYLAESLFLNTVKYENDKLEAYMRRLSQK